MVSSWFLLLLLFIWIHGAGFRASENGSMQRRKGTWKCGQELKSSQKPACQSTEPSRYTFGWNLRVCWLCSLEFCSEMVVVQSCPALSNPMDCSTPGFPVLLYLLEFAQTHVIESVTPSNDLILCLPLLFCPQSFWRLDQKTS